MNFNVISLGSTAVTGKIVFAWSFLLSFHQKFEKRILFT
jgi:hypothetical protein